MLVALASVEYERGERGEYSSSSIQPQNDVELQLGKHFVYRKERQLLWMNLSDFPQIVKLNDFLDTQKESHMHPT